MASSLCGVPMNLSKRSRQRRDKRQPWPEKESE
jgi:hypothetical protein